MIKQRKPKTSREDLPLSNEAREQITQIAQRFVAELDGEAFRKKYASLHTVLQLAGAGLFVTSAIVFPNAPKFLHGLLKNPDERTLWKRFNIPYLKRTLSRLEKQKLVEINDHEHVQSLTITDRGRKRILQYALDSLSIKKPRLWDGKWRLVSYDIPGRNLLIRGIFRDYLRAWGFYQFHKSVYLHAYPCEQEVEFLREYLGIGGHVRILTVTRIENDQLFREYFGI